MCLAGLFVLHLELLEVALPGVQVQALAGGLVRQGGERVLQVRTITRTIIKKVIRTNIRTSIRTVITTNIRTIN